MPAPRRSSLLAEKMITLGKKSDLAAYRQAMSFITREDVCKKLFKEIAPSYAERNGGYPPPPPPPPRARRRGGPPSRGGGSKNPQSPPAEAAAAAVKKPFVMGT